MFLVSFVEWGFWSRSWVGLLGAVSFAWGFGVVVLEWVFEVFLGGVCTFLGMVSGTGLWDVFLG